MQLIEIEQKFTALYRDLKAVGQETQLTNNHLLLRKTMESLPEVYANEMVKELTEEEDKPVVSQRSLYNMINDFHYLLI